MIRAILHGAAAGAAGTTALDVVSYADMAIRGRPASSTPERTIEALAAAAGLRVPGEGERRRSRLQAVGALAGLATGVGVGAVLGLARELGWRPGPVAGGLVTGGLAMLAANAPMTVLGITDPRTWSAADWVSDIAPHLAYGLVAHATLAAMD
jgi:hypothetical protein